MTQPNANIENAYFVFFSRCDNALPAILLVLSLERPSLRAFDAWVATFFEVTFSPYYFLSDFMKPISRFRDSKEPITILWDWCCWQEQMGQKPWMYQSAYCQLGIMAQCTMNCHSPQSEHVLRQYLQLRYTRLYCRYLLCNQFSVPRNLSNWSSRMEERHLPQFRWCSSLSQLTYY